MIGMAFYYNQDFLESLSGKGIPVDNIFRSDLRDGLGKTHVVAGFDKINSSIYTILSTRVGERAFMPEFGSKLYRCVFEQDGNIFNDLVRLYTKEALNSWEKRIVVDEVDVSRVKEDSTVDIIIYYRIRNSNVSGSYVYPFNLSVTGDVVTYDFTVTENLVQEGEVGLNAEYAK